MMGRVTIGKADPRAERRTGWVALGLLLGAVCCLLASVAAVHATGPSVKPGSPADRHEGAVIIWCGFVGMPLLGLVGLNVGVMAWRTWQGRAAVALFLSLVVALVAMLKLR